MNKKMNEIVEKHGSNGAALLHLLGILMPGAAAGGAVLSDFLAAKEREQMKAEMEVMKEMLEAI